MSSIEKMSIQGIRSFGPDDRERQIIQFYTPLTLILGPNGTGKTTIIECLKYMTTGNLPPGAGKEGAFIHDPKVAGEREIKAQIRLQFRDVRNQQCIVNRSLTATQKMKKVSMTTLECVLTRRDSEGNKTSISSKCIEMNNEMVTLLGVAKPVLENVIFCHQEDSNWPLSEGKTLKQKFDDIFASTRYVKALDVIKKFRSEQSQAITVYKGEIKYLKQNKDKAQQLQADFDEATARCISSKERVKELIEKLEPILQQLNKIRDQEGNIHKLNTQIEKLKSEVKLMERSQQELRDNIEHEFTGTTEELQEAIAEFENKVKEREDSLRQLRNKLDRAEREVARMSQEKSKLLIEHGKLQQEAQRHLDDIRKRDTFVHKVASECDFEGFSGVITESGIDRFRRQMEIQAKDLLEKAKEERAKFEEKEAELQEKIDEIRNCKARLETELKMKADRMTDNKNQIHDINQQLGRIEASAERLSTITHTLERKEKELNKVENSLDVDALKNEVAKLQKEKVEFEVKQRHLDAEMNRMHLESSARTQLEVFQKERDTKQEQIRKLKTKNEESIEHLLGHVPVTGLRRALEDCTSDVSRQVAKELKKFNDSKMKLSSLETERRGLKEQINQKEQKLKSYQDQLFEECESQNFDEGINKLEGKIRTAQDNKGLLMGAKHVTNKYISKLRQVDPPCPLCLRKFDSSDEVEELIQQLEDRLRMIPTKLENVTTELETSQEKFNRMQQLLPVKANMVDLEENEIPVLKNKEKTFSQQIEELRNSISEMETSIEVRQADEESAKSMLPDMVMIDRYQTELKELERKIASQASRLSGGDSSRTVEQVTSEKEDNQLLLDETNMNLDHKRQKLTEHIDRVQHLRTEVNDSRTEKLQIDQDLQRRTTLETTKVELQATNSTLIQEIKDTKEQLQPLQTRIETLQSDKEELTQTKEQKYEQDKDKFSKVKENRKLVDQLQKEIDRYVNGRCEEKLEECAENIKELEVKLTQGEEDKERLNTNINKIQKDLSTQQVRERELSDNLTLRRKEDEINKKKKDLSKLEQEMGGIDVYNLGQEKTDLMQKESDILTDKQRAEVRLRNTEGQLLMLKKELDTDQYRNAEKDHREKMIELRTTELANSDLDKYYTALDRTINSYHHQKMAEINKIIRELWRNTYRGNDIETIEIRSDEEEGSGAAKKKRTYNYRVVMIKGETALDMRGRCSAGQKVLASLIIRLALAETFCLNCGILCLDEPTTNLDRENIESLAYALVEIIKGRKKQKNFQLIVITHDEDFVDLLGRSDYVDEFFKVRKDPLGHSQLVKAKVQDLHSR